MAAKVIKANASAEAEPIHWPLLQPGASQAPPKTATEQEVRALQLRLAELEQELVRREQQAFEAGYRKGAEQGHQQASAQWKPVLEEFAQSLRELRQARQRMRREAERDLVELAVAIARRILHRELSVDPQALLGIVKAALDRLESREVDRLRVNPEDAELIGNYLAQTGLGQIEIVADRQLARGSVVLETVHGSLDASVETQLEEIKRGLLDRLRRHA